MTKAHTKDGDDNRQWFLRTGGEAVFGPVSTEGLIVWAEQGRVLPGHEVSLDRKEWQSAVSLAILDMRWFIDEGDGELRGPLNRVAAEALIASGKVTAGAQIVGDDEVELPDADEGSGYGIDAIAGVDSESGEVSDEIEEGMIEEGVVEGGEGSELADESNEVEGSDNIREGVGDVMQSLPDDVLHARIRELELIVSEQRERLQRVAEAGDLETVQHERDLMKSLLAEKESEFGKACAALKLEAEEIRNRLGGKVAELEVAVAERDKLQGRVAAMEGELLEHIRVIEEKRANEVAATLASERAKELASELSGRLAKAERRIEELEGEADELRSESEGGEKLRQELELKLAEMGVKLSQVESELAEILQESNSRDSENMERMAELERLCSITPEQADQMYADQLAAYELLKRESDALGSTLDQEREHFESLKKLMGARVESLIERRNILLRQIGGGPADMVRHLTRGQATDPNLNRLRDELTGLRRVHQQKMVQFEEQERERKLQLRVLESEVERLKTLAVIGEEADQRLAVMKDELRMREHELAEERKMRELEREQFDATNEALTMRIAALERSGQTGGGGGSNGGSSEEGDLRSVKLASWLSLQK